MEKREEETIKIHNLGKSRRLPLTSLPPQPTNVVQPVFVNVNVKPIPSTIIKSITTYPPICMLKPPRIIKQHIGRPF
jgi:hypothetical protein